MIERSANIASTPQTPEPTLDIREQIARIDQIQADIGQKLAATAKTGQDVRYAPWAIIFTGLGAGAALFAAGAAFMKILVG